MAPAHGLLLEDTFQEGTSCLGLEPRDRLGAGCPLPPLGHLSCL